MSVCVCALAHADAHTSDATLLRAFSLRVTAFEIRIY